VGREFEEHQFDVPNFLLDHGIRPASITDRHFQEGWLNIPCPFCTGNPGNHLGWNEESGRWNCFRCGTHPLEDVVSSLLGNLPEREVFTLIKGYLRTRRRTPKSGDPRDPERENIQLPPETGPLKTRHLEYLESRGFSDPEKVRFTWNLKGTGPTGRFKHRIIAPIYHRGRMVSFQGRDITDRSPLRYKSCPKHLEVRPIKSCLYGSEKLTTERSVVVVEGIIDVWKLGPGSVGTFGISWTKEQLELLGEFDHVSILFDPDRTAISQGIKLAETLVQNGVEVFIVETETDPGDMEEEEALELMYRITPR